MNGGREPWGETSITRVTKGTKYKHALVLEESDVAGLDGLLGWAEAGLVDLLLVPGQLLVQLLDLLVHRLTPLVYLTDRMMHRALEKQIIRRIRLN